MKSKTNKWLVIIITNGVQCFNEKFKSIEDIAKDLQLSKNIVFDIASNRRTAEKYKNCRFFPQISITRLP